MITKNEIQKNKKQVLLGMSGGIDSTVAAYLLQQQGYEVIGLTINTLPCKKDRYKEIKNICKKLKIKHISIDLHNIFDKNIVQYFISEYLNGRTPNPCVLCNKEFKFENIIKKADELGIKYIATGHYVRLESKQNRYILKKAKDISKDQSYVLYRLSQKQLSRCIFPLGNYNKKDIRQIAQNLGLSNALKKDSQDICFVENNDYTKLISNIDTKKGDIVDKYGNIIGKHNGIYHYTVGQRKKIGISSNEPLYVIKIDVEKNRVIVGKEKDIYSNELIVKDINWIIKLPKKIFAKVKIRYHTKEALAYISSIEKNKAKIKFLKAQRAITPGQSAVFYIGKYIVGGGIIE